MESSINTACVTVLMVLLARNVKSTSTIVRTSSAKMVEIVKIWLTISNVSVKMATMEGHVRMTSTNASMLTVTMDRVPIRLVTLHVTAFLDTPVTLVMSL